MFPKKSLFVLATLLLLSCVTVQTAKAAPECYTLASLEGSYTIIGHYGAHLAIALASGHFDGAGNFTSTFLVNEPLPGSTTGERKLVTGSQTGTYTVNCDGTGVITRVITLSTGLLGTVVSDLIITRAVHNHSERGEVPIATELVDAQRVPSLIVPGGTFLTRTYTRLPDRPGQSDSTEP